MTSAAIFEAAPVAMLGLTPDSFVITAINGHALSLFRKERRLDVIGLGFVSEFLGTSEWAAALQCLRTAVEAGSTKTASVTFANRPLTLRANAVRSGSEVVSVCVVLDEKVASGETTAAPQKSDKGHGDQEPACIIGSANRIESWSLGAARYSDTADTGPSSRLLPSRPKDFFVSQAIDKGHEADDDAEGHKGHLDSVHKGHLDIVAHDPQPSDSQYSILSADNAQSAREVQVQQLLTDAGFIDLDTVADRADESDADDDKALGHKGRKADDDKSHADDDKGHAGDDDADEPACKAAKRPKVDRGPVDESNLVGEFYWSDVD